jgi:uncharacterized protein with HXXEE motif
MRLSFVKWLWFFPLAYLLHVVEEFMSVGPLYGINVSLNLFLILSTAAWMLMICGIVLAQRFGFSQFMGVCLGTTVFLNGLTHIVNSLVYGRYDGGLISGSVIFIPLGLGTLISLRNSMRKQRYVFGVLIGMVIQAIALGLNVGHS